MLSLKWDAAARRFYVVRGIDSYVWEGYDSGGGVILSRERRKWVRELVGAVALDDFTDAGELRDGLIRLLFHAVVGTSRLPLPPSRRRCRRSPSGNCSIVTASGTGGPVRSVEALARAIVRPGLNRLERVKLLEAFLHAVPSREVGAAACRFAPSLLTANGLYRSLKRPFQRDFAVALYRPWRKDGRVSGRAGARRLSPRGRRRGLSRLVAAANRPAPDRL